MEVNSHGSFSGICCQQHYKESKIKLPEFLNHSSNKLHTHAKLRKGWQTKIWQGNVMFSCITKFQSKELTVRAMPDPS